MIGGGPAGASAALHLARLGHAVTLVERSTFPRPQVGEALAPSIWPVLDLLGLRTAVEAAGFARSEGALLRWADDRDERIEPSAGRFGLTVDRGRFDLLILDAAQRAGVRVLQPARARAPLRTGRGWSVPIEDRDGEATIEASFLVDAAGRHSNVGPTPAAGAPETVALYGVWRGSPLVPGPSRVEAGATAWYWGAPRPDGTFSAMVFVAGRGQWDRAAIESDYRSLLARSSLLGDCLKGSPADAVRLRDATARRNGDCIGEAFVRIGEASFALDPLSSQGVQAAMMSGFQAAIVVHTIRAYPEDAACASTFYRDAQREGFTRHCRTVAGLYAEARRFAHEPFWQARAAGAAAPAPSPAVATPLPDQPLRLAADAQIRPTPIIDHDRIRQRPALHHPVLERPVAFLEGVELTPLLQQVTGDARAVLTAWAASIPPQQGGRILAWLLQRGIVVADSAVGAVSSRGARGLP